MNNLLNKKFLLVSVLILSALSCKDDFLDRPPEDAFNVTDFYQTTAQVNSATNALYVTPWYDFISSSAWVIGEISSGNARTYDARTADFLNFAVNGNHETLSKTWQSLYAVIAQSNAIINTLPDAVGVSVPKNVVNNALGEARFIRSVAYFYLVRIFGSIPIIANNNNFVLESFIPRNLETDVYTFIKRDLEFAMANCFQKVRGSDYDANGKVSSGSAKALLAKIHLYEKDYAMAYQLADEVINSGEFRLFGGDAADGDPNGSYFDLFKTENDNNPESIFALQWSTSGNYGEGNGLQSQFAQAGVTGFSDGWGSVGPSVDLQEAYEDKVLDKRFYATIQALGAFYPDLNGGFTVSESIDVHDTRAAIKKYVVGTAASNGGGSQQNYPNNTYILRYGELLLIHAEAALNGGGSVTEGTESLNKVRRRAGLANIASPTLDDIFQERRIELAYEFEFWYDIVRRGPAFALNFLSNTERGTFDNNEPPAISSIKYPATTDNLLFPYPVIETQSNPALLEEPVAYNFGN